MTDQCKYCILKEKLNDCLKSDCGHHENWINKELMQKINQQAAELAALRGFIKSMREYQDNVIRSAVIRECLAFNLTDNRGKPTKLLTGDE